MIKIIENQTPQKGYVVEEENASSVSLLYYEKDGKRFVPDLMETYSKEMFIEISNEAELRELFSDYVKPSDTIFVRKEVADIVSKF